MLGMRFSRCCVRTSRSRRAARRSESQTWTESTSCIRSIACSTSSSPMSRCVTARSQPGRRPPTRTPRSSEPLAQAGLVGDRDEVRLHGCGIDPDAFREPPRACVVVGQPLDVVVERVEHRGRGDARLPERAAEEELALPGALDRLGGAGEDRAERAAEPLREADRDGVGERSPGRRLDAGRDRGVEEPRAVEVDGGAAGARGIDASPGTPRAARSGRPSCDACSRARARCPGRTRRPPRSAPASAARPRRRGPA